MNRPAAYLRPAGSAGFPFWRANPHVGGPRKPASSGRPENRPSRLPVKKGLPGGLSARQKRRFGASRDSTSASPRSREPHAPLLPCATQTTTSTSRAGTCRRNRYAKSAALTDNAASKGLVTGLLRETQTVPQGQDVAIGQTMPPARKAGYNARTAWESTLPPPGCERPL